MSEKRQREGRRSLDENKIWTEYMHAVIIVVVAVWYAIPYVSIY